MSNNEIPKLCAIRRDEPRQADAILVDIADRLAADGAKIAGVLQRDTLREGRRRCDMDLLDLSSGTLLRISQDRGNEARGCRLDEGALAGAAARMEAQIRSGADLVVINKFGKAEAEGRGLRDVIALALLHDIPVLMGVSDIAVEALKQFAGDLCMIIDADPGLVHSWLQEIVATGINPHRSVLEVV